MPTITHLCGARNLTSLRTPLTCKSTSTLVCQGPATQPSGAPAWLLFLCIEHAQALPDWPGAPADPDDPPLMACGAVLDYSRSSTPTGAQRMSRATAATATATATAGSMVCRVTHSLFRVRASEDLTVLRAATGHRWPPADGATVRWLK
ncbi:hypothetical protein [Streptomyces longhuiensis]|uniref:hypothetical protein n=1 Tax=Streptomyces longhuiensis TaxID=2880933 RepID=UPI001D0AE329|nr:hypothetical protein [Streptomyces longhuiensis]UDM05519.1 hypothetical protein LGI35_45565 [Streptomyces longhuiensis]